MNEAQANNTLALEAAKFATPEKPVAPPKFTPEELKEVEDLMKENADWMDGLMEKQVQLEGDATKDPVILTKDLDERGKRLQMLVSGVIRSLPIHSAQVSHWKEYWVAQGLREVKLISGFTLDQ